jgi:hypothetical protein
MRWARRFRWERRTPLGYLEATAEHGLKPPQLGEPFIQM